MGEPEAQEMTFTTDLAKFREEAPKAADQVRRKIILDLFSNIVRDTPVDTGRARGNWQTTVSAPAADTLERFGEAASLADIPDNISGPDGTTVMANNLPYAERLEYGWSKQQPEGMVRRNVARLVAIVKKSKAGTSL